MFRCLAARIMVVAGVAAASVTAASAHDVRAGAAHAQNSAPVPEPTAPDFKHGAGMGTPLPTPALDREGWLRTCREHLNTGDRGTAVSARDHCDALLEQATGAIMAYAPAHGYAPYGYVMVPVTLIPHNAPTRPCPSHCKETVVTTEYVTAYEPRRRRTINPRRPDKRQPMPR